MLEEALMVGGTINILKSKLEHLFDRIDKLYNNDLEYQYVKSITASLESELSADKDFFNPKKAELRSKKINHLVQSMTTGNQVVYEFVKYEFESPFGIFSLIFDEKIPDVGMSNILIKAQLNTVEFEDIHVPEHVQEGFAFFLEHFVNNLKFINEKKLDMSDAIMDASFGIFRFNVVHSSLNSRKGPIISVRKHVQGVSEKETVLDDEKYESSLGLNQSEIEKLKEYSGKSICIFGAPGSGKTTILRYLLNHKLDEKRNLCIIEDTPELGILTNISLVTSKNYNIKELFNATLRQNPSHLGIGETRTEEIVDIMESGLTFSVSTTLHANSLYKAFERIYFMSRPRGLNKEDVHDLISASMDMFVFMDNRQVKGIWVRNEKISGDIHSRYDEISIPLPSDVRIRKEVNEIKRSPSNFKLGEIK